MKKLLPLILIGSGLLLLAGCACDEMMCENKSRTSKVEQKSKPVAASEKKACKKPKNVKIAKPAKAEKKTTKKASSKKNKNTKKSSYHKEVITAEEPQKTAKAAQKENKKHAYQDLSELAPWADFDREVVA